MATAADNLTTLGENIQRLRAATGRKVVDLAQEVGIARQYWYMIEVAQVNPTFDTVERIADVFGVTVRDLLDPAFEIRAQRRPRR